MKKIKIVIGKNFGDEGKGAAVYRFCRGNQAIVVRHNGGAQAGHTVEDGSFRFVFHQLGSGSSLGCSTYWSHTFLPDLLKLGDEAAELGVCFIGTVYAHPDCACTTIYDVLLNSVAEQLRGNAKHGSCGMGIYETVLRSRKEAYVLRLKEIEKLSLTELAEKLRLIRDEYASLRLQELLHSNRNNDTPQSVQDWLEIFYDDNVLWNAAEEMYSNFRKYVKLEPWEDIIHKYDMIVIENAQGLMLDEDNEEYYPHLTPSHTGLYNVAELLDVFVAQGLEYEVEIAYITRTYVTRHGAGRLDYECRKEDINPDMVDKTNVPNPWQDALRYGKHPAGEEFFRYIKKDMMHLKQGGHLPRSSVKILVTHLDETDGKLLFADKSMDFMEFQELCRRHMGVAALAANCVQI